MKSRLNPGAQFILLGYSFGTMPALKLTTKLESEGNIHLFHLPTHFQ